MNMRSGPIYDRVLKYRVQARLTGPLHVGSAEGGREEILIHPVEDVPFIQASSICGALRSWYSGRYGREEAARLFGDISSQSERTDSHIKVTDGRFLEPDSVKLEYRPRVRIDPVSGSVSSSVIGASGITSGHKFDLECVGGGAVFTFALYFYGCGSYEIPEEQILGMFSAIKSGEILFGGSKSTGYGSVAVEKLFRKDFDLKSPNGRALWAEEYRLPDQKTEEISGKLSSESFGRYRIVVHGKTESGLLVKGYVVSGFGEGFPDASGMRNALKDFIVPGSSLKGVIRSRAEVINGYLKRQGVSHAECLIEGTFGSSAENGTSGNAVFRDAVIGDREKNEKLSLSHHIHIDKLTGGVFNGGLFAEKNTFGEVCFEIGIGSRNDPKASCALILLVLRDLAHGIINIGSGYASGKGIIKVSRIEITGEEGKAALDFEKNRQENQPMIDGLIQALYQG